MIENQQPAIDYERLKQIEDSRKPKPTPIPEVKRSSALAPEGIKTCDVWCGGCKLLAPHWYADHAYFCCLCKRRTAWVCV